MRIIYFANGIRGLRCLEELIISNEDVVAVVGHPGIKSELLKLADKEGIKSYQPDKVNSLDFIEEMRLFKADLFILAGYNRILKKKLINLPSIGCINLHGGRLPEYRGCAPINWQIINGEKVGGCCILFVDEGIDTGDIISQSYYDILETDSSLDIVNKQLHIFPKMLLKVVHEMKDGSYRAVPQDINKGCYYTRRYPRDSIIKWESMTAEQICNMVRALVDPYPNAFTYYNNSKVRIRKARIVAPSIKGIPGRISLKRPEGIIVSCADDSILVTEVAMKEDGMPCNPISIFNIGSDFSSKQ